MPRPGGSLGMAGDEKARVDYDVDPGRAFLFVFLFVFRFPISDDGPPACSPFRA
jgi:hypothetical protein